MQEYFYNDYVKIGLVLGASFLEIKKNRTSFMKIDSYDATDLEDRTIYSIRKLDDVEEYEFLKMVKDIYGG